MASDNNGVETKLSKLDWPALLLNAGIDFVITAGTGLMAAMVTEGRVEIPSPAVLILSSVAGILSGARTVRAALDVEVKR